MEEINMRKSIIAALVVLLFIFAGTFATTLLAQEGRGNGRLLGFVKDTDKNPIEGVIVKIHRFQLQVGSKNRCKGKICFLRYGTRLG
jgi:hypothetical protein